jgi:hypothetical protein
MEGHAERRQGFKNGFYVDLGSTRDAYVKIREAEANEIFDKIKDFLSGARCDSCDGGTSTSTLSYSFDKLQSLLHSPLLFWLMSSLRAVVRYEEEKKLLGGRKERSVLVFHLADDTIDGQFKLIKLERC